MAWRLQMLNYREAEHGFLAGKGRRKRRDFRICRMEVRIDGNPFPCNGTFLQPPATRAHVPLPRKYIRCTKTATQSIAAPLWAFVCMATASIIIVSLMILAAYFYLDERFAVLIAFMFANVDAMNEISEQKHRLGEKALFYARG